MSSTIDNIECPNCGGNASFETDNKTNEKHIWCHDCNYDSDYDFDDDTLFDDMYFDFDKYDDCDGDCDGCTGCLDCGEYY